MRESSDQAFAHLNAGNAAKRATFKYNPADTTKWLGSIVDVFSPALFDRLGGHGVQSNLPVFVCGVPRSGTTLVEQILASHPSVHGAGELKLMKYTIDGMRGFPEVMGTMTPEQVTKVGENYISRVMPLAGGKARLVDKMPANFLYAGLIHLAMPEAHIIHCRRNPVDTCLSCYTKLFRVEQTFTYDLEELGRFYRDYEIVMDHWRKILPASRFLEVDYEAIVEDTETEVRRMLDFLGLPWDDACLEPHRTERVVRTASVSQVRKPIYKTSSGRWRKHARNLGPLLEVLGIDPEADKVAQ